MTEPERIGLSRYDSKRDAWPKGSECTWASLARELATPRRTSCTAASCKQSECLHKNGPAWSPALYPARKRRKAENVETVSLLVIDIDHVTDQHLIEIDAQLSLYRRIIHASHSDKPGDRCVRVVLAISRPLAGKEWDAFWTAATCALGVPADPATCDASRIYFLPSRPLDANYYFALFDGNAVDVDAILAARDGSCLSDEKAPAQLDAIADGNKFGPGERHNMLVSVASAMRHRGANEHEIARVLLRKNQLTCVPAKPEDEVRAIAAWVSDKPPGDRLSVRDASALSLADLCHAQMGLDEEKRRTIVRWAGRWWRYGNGIHRTVEDEMLRGEVWNVLSRVDVEALDNEGGAQFKRLSVTSRRVSEVIDAMMAAGDLIASNLVLPVALDGYEGPSPERVAIVRNGLLDLTTGTLHPPSPRLFATAGAAVDYEATAVCPCWERFLAEIFTGDDGPDEEAIRLVRQIFGWLIAGDVSRHAIPLFIGPTRSGKSTMMAVLRELLGVGNVCSPPLTSLAESRFGFAPLLGKSVAIIPDARLGTRADQAAVAGLLLAVSGHDPVTIDRKGRDAIEARLRCRIVIVTNELPRITDASGALANRYLIVETRCSFLGREDLQLEDRLRAELPGVLRWALDGWRDLVANGWTRPARTREIVDELDRLGSPIRAFIGDSLVVAPGNEASLEALYREWMRWCFAKGRNNPGTESSFARDLRAAVPGMRNVRRRVGGDGSDKRQLVYLGIGVRTSSISTTGGVGAALLGGSS